MKRKIILTVSLFLMLLTLFALSISAEELVETWDISATENDSVTAYLYEYDTDRYSMVVSGSGNMKSWAYSDETPWYIAYNSRINSLTIGNGVTNIGDNAFVGFSIGRVTIPNTVKSIGRFAFYLCDLLSSVVIPDSVTTIGDYAFHYCTSLTSVVIGDSVTTIGDSAFSNCDSLTSVVIPDSVTAMGDYAFYSCDSLTSVVIGDSVAVIGNSAFEYCTSLTSVVIGNSVATIGDSAFYSCKSLTSVEIPDGVTAIESSVFSGCKALIKVVIPNSVTSIGNTAFHGCSSLTNIELPNNIASIGDWAFSSCGLVSIVIPDSVTIMGELVFNGCSSLTTAVIGDGVKSIDRQAFAYCTSLKSVVIGNGVTIICEDAFYICRALTCVILGDSVTTIGSFAFYDCRALTSIFIPDSVTTIVDNAFISCTSLTIYAEAESQPSGWNSSWNSSNRPVEWGHTHSYDFETDLCVCGVSITGYTQKWNISATSSDNVIAYLYNDPLNSGYYTLTMAGKGNMKNWSYGSSWLTSSYSSKIKSATIKKGVTNIGSSAFWYCPSLTSIVIPDSVTTIGSYAFYDCRSITSIEILDSITTIGYSAFYYCRSLTSVVIPDSVTTIGDRAFSYCDSLTSIEVSENNTAYCDIAGNLYTKDKKTLLQYAVGKKDISFAIPNGVTTISDSAFGNCTSLTSIEIPNSVTIIDDGAFANCASLISIELPDSVTTIGDEAFSRCYALTSFVIPDSVTTIGGHVFFYCSSLKSIEIPSGLRTISGSMFSNCSSLKSIVIPDSVTSIGSYAFSYCSRLTSIVIPNNVTSIGSNTFAGCSSLKSIVIPDSVTTIGNSAFYDCNSLTSIAIPDSVTSIDDRAFYSCDSLTSVVIPNSVTRIGASAFANCTQLTIYAEASSQPSGWNSRWNSSNRPVVWGYVHQHTEVEIPAVRPAPSNNHTGWSAGVMCSDCGETLVVPVEMVAGTSSDVNFKINSATLSLGEDIGVTYNATHPANSSADSMYMVFVFDGKEFFVESAGVVTGNRYRFVFKGMRADLMAANIEAYVYAIENGNYVMKSHLQYSVKQYCVNQLKRTIDAEFETLIYSVLNLGDCTQLAVNSETPAEQLVSKIVTAETGKVVPGVAVETIDPSYNVQALTGDRTQGYDWKSGGIALGSSVKLKLQFTASDVKGLVLKFDIAGERTIEIDASELTPDSNGRYTVYFQVKVLEYDDTITCTFEKNGEAVGSTLTYSVYTYLVRSYTNENLPEADRSFMKSLYEYAEAVKAMNE